MPETVAPIFQEAPLIIPHPSDPDVVEAYCIRGKHMMLVFRKSPLNDVCPQCQDSDAVLILG